MEQLSFRVLMAKQHNGYGIQLLADNDEAKAKCDTVMSWGELWLTMCNHMVIGKRTRAVIKIDGDVDMEMQHFSINNIEVKNIFPIHPVKQ